ncbi:tail completion protein gp17 [Sphingosinicella sp.]|uniref:tail completion protein gp17 n=1 Tax=Sphingosinicella sp. TaxID=1917971 RepID=UPI0040381D7B
MTSASEALAAAALGALAGTVGLNGAYEGVPVKASLPYAAIELGPESDWGWKGGEGREVRLAVTIRDAGERPGRLRRLMAAAEVALLGLDGAVEGWRIVNVVTSRTRTAQKRAGEWTGMIEVRVRMEREN